MADTLKYTYTRKIYPNKNDKSVFSKMRYFKRDIPKKVVDVIGKPKAINFSLHTNNDADVRRFQPQILKLFAEACENALKVKRWEFDPSGILGIKQKAISQDQHSKPAHSTNSYDDSDRPDTFELPYDANRLRVAEVDCESAHDLSDIEIAKQLEGRVPITIEELIAVFLTAKKLVWTTEKTYTQYKHALKLLYLLTPRNTSLHVINPHLVTTNWLLKITEEWISKKRSKATVLGYITKWSTLWEWALARDYVAKNPWRKLDIRDERHQGEITQNFNDFDQKRMWNSPLYTLELYDEPYMYWVPLLMKLGLRLNEACQIYVSDVVKEPNDVWAIHITDTDLRTMNKAPDKSLKRKSARRKIPVHQGLVDLGFLTWIENLNKQKRTRLFEELKYSKSAGYSRYPSDNLNDWLRIEKIHMPRVKTIESMRGTVKTELKESNAFPWIRDAILGHSEHVSKMDSRYEDPYTAEGLQPYVDKIPFPKTIKPFKWMDGSFDIEVALNSKGRKGRGNKSSIKAYKFRRSAKATSKELYDPLPNRDDMVLKNPWATDLNSDR